MKIGTVRKVNEIIYNYDPYEYMNCYGDLGTGFQDCLKALQESPESIADVIKDILESDDDESKKEIAGMGNDLINYFDSKGLFSVGDLILENMIAA